MMLNNKYICGFVWSASYLNFHAMRNLDTIKKRADLQLTDNCEVEFLLNSLSSICCHTGVVTGVGVLNIRQLEDLVTLERHDVLPLTMADARGREGPGREELYIAFEPGDPRWGVAGSLTGHVDRLVLDGFDVDLANGIHEPWSNWGIENGQIFNRERWGLTKI